jgi:putative transposase
VPGVPLHIVQRGNNRAHCFFGDLDRRYYLKCLAEAASARGCAVHAYVLMSNHVHLLLTPISEGAASLMLQDVGRQYVSTINRAHGRSGTLWEGRFKSSLIDSDRYLFTCHRYIEMNPVRAGIATAPGNYAWSSHGYYAGTRRDGIVTPHPLYAALGESSASRRSAFLAMFGNEIPGADLERLRVAINKGWALGSETFLDCMQRQIGRTLRPPRLGRPPKRPAEPSTRSETAGQPEMLL